MAFMLIDLDRFKEINDALGHQAGDILLKQIAPRLCTAVDIPATVARLGGDEFGLVLPHINSEEDALHAAEKVLAVICQPFDLEGLKVQIGASIGIALYPDHSDDPHSMMRCADIAMYLAKKNGGGYAVYNPTLDIYSPRRLSLITSLRIAILENQLVLHYQPKISLKDHDVIGMEALIRWQHPQHGLVAPNEFIPLAEVSDLIMPLTQWVLGNVLQQMREWHDMGIKANVAANISARNLQDSDLPDKIAALLEKHQIPPHYLELEITESAIIVDPLRATETLRRIHELGVILSIDDFGTGYTSLSHLRKLPISTLKIDLSFISNMLISKDDAALVQSIIHLGHNLGMDVIAEGVENQDTLSMLGVLECDVVQGNLISPPMAATQMTQWLRSRC
jgi:diguanylate cyclase (GGDEF)-like protein